MIHGFPLSRMTSAERIADAKAIKTDLDHRWDEKVDQIPQALS